jgi:hypothetical protein
LPSCASTSPGTSFGRLGHEEDADALAADQPDGAGDGVEERLAGVVEEQVRLVEEEDELGLVDVADLGQVVEQVGEQPHQEGAEQLRLVLHGGERHHRQDAPAVRCHPEQVGGVELGLAEEHVAAVVLERDEGTQDDAGGRRRQPAQALELGLALVTREVGDDGAQVLEVEQREPGLVGEVEDQAEAGLLGGIEVEHLAQQHGAEGGDGRPHRHAGADPAQRVELDRRAGRGPRGRRLARPLRTRSESRPRPRPDRSPLMSARKAGTPAAESCSAMSCSVLVLPVPVGAGDQPVPVQHRQRHPHRGLGVRRPSTMTAPELERRPLEGVGRTEPAASSCPGMAAPSVLTTAPVVPGGTLVRGQ